MPTSLRKSQLCAAAAAIVAVGLVTGPGPAQADPTIPLAPKCIQYGWPGAVALAHTNGWGVIFHSEGPRASGLATGVGHPDLKLSGSIAGGIHGDTVDFTIRWHNGSVGHYTGLVRGDGVAFGDTVDLTHPQNKAKWNTTKPLSCMTTADPQQPTPPPFTPGRPIERRKALVTGDVNVYDGINHPEGAANYLGILRKGASVRPLGDCKPDDWCQVEGDAVPGGKGWIWGFLKLP